MPINCVNQSGYHLMEAESLPQDLETCGEKLQDFILDYGIQFPNAPFFPHVQINLV